MYIFITVYIINSKIVISDHDGNKINSLWVKNIMPIFFPKVLIC